MALNNEDLFLVNQGGDTKKIKYENLVNYLNTDLSHPIHIGDTEPTDPNNGELWVDTSECPPKLMIYSECDGAGWIEIEGTPPLPEGDIDQPMILAPSDGAGPGTITYLKSDTITAVEGGGIKTCETDLIESVNVVNYDGTTTNVHSNSGPVSVLFNGEYVGSFTNKNIGSSTTAARGLIEFTPPVIDAAFVGHFSGNVGIDFDVEYVDGSTQKVDKVGLPGYAFEETPLENASGVARIRFYAGNGVNSEWIAGFKTADGTLITNDFVTLTFPSSNGFDCFEPGDVVQDPDVKVISKDADATPPTITVDGGEWVGTDTNKIEGGEDSRQEWSEISSNTGNAYLGDAHLKDKAFDGLETTICVSSTPNSVFTFDTSQFPLDGTIEMFYGPGGITVAATMDVRVDGGAVVTVPKNAWTEISSTGSSQSITITGVGTTFGISAFRVNGNLLVDGVGAGDNKLSKETPYDTKLTVAGSTDLADMTGSVFMTDGNPPGGPYTQTPYKLVTSEIESVSTEIWDFTGLVSEWDYNGIANPSHYPTSFGPFDPNPNSYVYFPGISDRGNAYAEMELLPIPTGTLVEIDWQGSSPENYRSTILQLLNANGDVVLETPFDNPSNNKTEAHRINAGALTGRIQKLRLTLDPNDDGSGISTEYVGGFSGIYFNGKKLTEGTYAQAALAFASPNPDLQYFKEGDVIPQENNPYNQDFINAPVFNDNGFAAYSASTVVSNIFDEDLSSWGLPVLGGYWDWTFPGEGIPVNGFIELEISGIASGIVLNNKTMDTISTLEGAIYKVNASDVDGYLKTLRVKYLSNSDYAYLKYIKVDQNLLVDESLVSQELVMTVIDVNVDDNMMVVDKSTLVAGDVVEYQTNGGEGTIVSVNTDDNTLLIADTGDRDNRWIAENKAGTDFAVAGPMKTDDFLTYDIEFISSEFSTTPADVDTFKNAKWVIEEVGGDTVTYDAGPVTNWKPGSARLKPSTDYKAYVIYEGDTLGMSPASATVSFRTGALRSAYEVFGSRLSALEAGQVADDAVDTALLSLISSLTTRVQALEESN